MEIFDEEMKFDSDPKAQESKSRLNGEAILLDRLGGILDRSLPGGRRSAADKFIRFLDRLFHFDTRQADFLKE